MVNPLLSSEELFMAGGWRVTRDQAMLPDGRVKKGVRVHRPDSVHVLAFPSQESILLLREFRPFLGRAIWMIPSGKVDKENDPSIAAQRELREETGFRSDDLQFYCLTRHTDQLVSKNHIYIARKLVRDPLSQEECEMIEVHEMPIREALDRVREDECAHLATGYALFRYAYEHGVNLPKKR